LISESLPIRRYFSICVGMMHMSPSEFWQSSPKEIFIALEGFSEFNGGKNEEPMNSESLENMMELYPD